MASSCFASAADSKYRKQKNKLEDVNTEEKEFFDMIRRQLEELEKENPEEQNLINKIRRKLEKLEKNMPEPKRTKQIGEIRQQDDKFLGEELDLEDGSDENLRQIFSSGGDEQLVIYDRALTESLKPKTVERLKKAGSIAIGYFNKKNPEYYYLEDVIKAITRPRPPGYVLDLTFTALCSDEIQVAKIFKAEIYFGNRRIEVDSVDFAT